MGCSYVAGRGWSMLGASKLPRRSPAVACTHVPFIAGCPYHANVSRRQCLLPPALTLHLVLLVLHLAQVHLQVHLAPRTRRAEAGAHALAAHCNAHNTRVAVLADEHVRLVLGAFRVETLCISATPCCAYYRFQNTTPKKSNTPHPAGP